MSKSVLYHAECNDGIMAAAVVSHFERDPNITFQPVYYKNPLPELDGQDIIMVDFCHDDLAAMMHLIESARSVTIIDHHIGALPVLTALQGMEAPNLTIKYAANDSGASATWKHYTDRTLPKVIELVRGHDLHINKSLQDDYFFYGVLTEVQTVAFWESLIEDITRVNQLVVAGKNVYDFIVNSVVPQTRLKVRHTQVEGYVIPVVNVSRLLQGIVLEELSKVAGVAMAYEDLPGKRKWSVRSTNTAHGAAIRIAKLYGGSGHENAAGFHTDHSFMFPMIDSPN